MNWTEGAFWACSWRGLADAWTGHARFTLGVEPDEDGGMTRDEALALESEFRAWQREPG